MADSMTNALILESLKAMQATLSEIADDLRDLKSDLRGVRGRKAVLKHGEVAQDNALTAIQTRLDRIERRLETSDQVVTRPADQSVERWDRQTETGGPKAAR